MRFVKVVDYQEYNKCRKESRMERSGLWGIGAGIAVLGLSLGAATIVFTSQALNASTIQAIWVTTGVASVLIWVAATWKR